MSTSDSALETAQVDLTSNVSTELKNDTGSALHPTHQSNTTVSTNKSTDGSSLKKINTDEALISRTAWVSGASGVISGFLATVLLHPLEVLKIRLQGDAGGKAKYKFTLRDVIRVSRRVGLYTGMSANLIASMAAWGVFFGMNDYLRIHGREKYTQYHNDKWEREHLFESAQNNNNNNNNNTHSSSLPTAGTNFTSKLTPPQPNLFGMDFATSMVASTIAQVVTQPLWLMKTRMSLDQIPLSQAGIDPEAALRHAQTTKLTSPYRSLLGGLIYTGRTQGIRGLYRGFSASLLGTTHGAIMMCSYTGLKEWSLVNTMLKDQPTWLQNIILPSYAAFLSKVIATLATYPTQVLRTTIQDHRVIQAQQANVPQPQQPPVQPVLKAPTPPLNQTTSNYSLWSATKDIWQASGVKGFYRGVSMQILRASLQNVVVFGVYEGSRSFIGSKTVDNRSLNVKKH